LNFNGFVDERRLFPAARRTISERIITFSRQDDRPIPCSLCRFSSPLRSRRRSAPS
jgi:hypothetical protein